MITQTWANSLFLLRVKISCVGFRAFSPGRCQCLELRLVVSSSAIGCLQRLVSVITSITRRVGRQTLLTYLLTYSMSVCDFKTGQYSTIDPRAHLPSLSSALITAVPTPISALVLTTVTVSRR